MIRSTLILSTTAMMLALSACSTKGPTTGNAIDGTASDTMNAAAISTTGNDAAPMDGAVTDGFADQDAVNLFASYSQFQSEIAKIAEQKAANPRIKSLAQAVGPQHAQEFAALKQLASDNGLQFNPTINPAMKDNLASLNKRTGDAFDRAYLQQQAAMHDTAISALKKLIRWTRNDKLKHWAETTLKAHEQQDKLVNDLYIEPQSTLE